MWNDLKRIIYFLLLLFILFFKRNLPLLNNSCHNCSFFMCRRWYLFSILPCFPVYSFLCQNTTSSQKRHLIMSSPRVINYNSYSKKVNHTVTDSIAVCTGTSHDMQMISSTVILLFLDSYSIYYQSHPIYFAIVHIPLILYINFLTIYINEGYS